MMLTFIFIFIDKKNIFFIDKKNIFIFYS